MRQETRVSLSGGGKHLTLKAEGTEMSAFDNGLPLSSIEDPRFETSGIFVQIEAGTL